MGIMFQELAGYRVWKYGAVPLVVPMVRICTGAEFAYGDVRGFEEVVEPDAGITYLGQPPQVKHLTWQHFQSHRFCECERKDVGWIRCPNSQNALEDCTAYRTFGVQVHYRRVCVVLAFPTVYEFAGGELLSHVTQEEHIKVEVESAVFVACDTPDLVCFESHAQLHKAMLVTLKGSILGLDVRIKNSDAENIGRNTDLLTVAANIANVVRKSPPNDAERRFLCSNQRIQT